MPTSTAQPSSSNSRSPHALDASFWQMKNSSARCTSLMKGVPGVSACLDSLDFWFAGAFAREPFLRAPPPGRLALWSALALFY